MRILILSEFFDPEPTLKGLAFAKALVAEGHKVEVLTGFPNYPGGKIYPGYKLKMKSREVVDGITVHRVALYPSHDRSGKRRLLTYGSFALSASLLGPWLVRRPDVLYIYHPPLTIGLPALILKMTKRCPAVIDIQDLWPDTLSATGMVREGFVTSLIGRWAKVVYSHMDRIVVLSPGFKARLLAPGGPAEKLRTIYNWNEETRQAATEPNEEFAERWGLKDRFVMMFAGSLGPAQALDTILDAAKLCLTTCPEALFAFVGQGMEKERLESRVREEEISNVTFIPHQPMESMGGIFPLADALLVHLKDEPLFEITVPSKVQAYLSAGIPLIVGLKGDAANLVRSSQAGIVVPPEDAEAMAGAVSSLWSMTPEARRSLGENGKSFYEQNLSMAIGVKQFSEVFRCAAHHAPHVHGTRGRYLNYGKRLLDLAIVIPALLLLIPLFLLIVLGSLMTMGGPVFFSQTRAGRDGKPFKIYKFRSMKDVRGADGEPLPDEERTPAFGAFLRKSSLDELPGLLNVLRGEMSLVGPRPLLPEYLPRYNPYHARRHEVLPGITGMAQINGRQLALFSQRMELDVWYVENASLWTDLKILFMTLPKVLGARGVVPGQHVQDVDDLGLSKPVAL